MDQSFYRQEEEQLTPRSDYAGLLRRAIAFIIDGVLLGLVFSGLRIALGSLLDYNSERGFFTGRKAFELLLTFAYFTYFDSEKKGGTLGKQTMSMQVVGEDDLPLPLEKAALRAVTKVVLGWVPLLWLFPLFSDYRQALHDKVAKSFVMDNSLPARTRRD